MPGLGTLYGLGGATTHLMDMQNSDLIVIQGSNCAENHPVGFRFAMMAKERGAKIVHVDPRFTRTSALADLYIPIRAGTDIAFTGGLINYVLSNDAYFKDYVHTYTNASYLVHPEFRDTEDLDGLFSGFDPESKTYDPKNWRYEIDESSAPKGGEGGASVNGNGKRPVQDPTLQHPRCVINVIKRHYARYTPEMVEQITGAPRESFLTLARWLVENSGRERTAVYAYAMGWAQHTIGVQNIRAAATLQALLGNTGRPGGGVMALRGHASIQGSTDIATLYDNFPGYLKVPTLEKDETDFATWREHHTMRSGRWAGFPGYAVSFLKAWYGDAAHASNDWGFAHLPLNTGDHSDLPMFFAMKDGEVEGLLLYGQNPAVGGQNAALQRGAMERLKWMVVRDMFETESASFWKREGADPASIGTEVFYFPAAGVAEKHGSFTNTMRLVQFHEKAVDPPGEARSDLAFTYELGKRLKALYAGSTRPIDSPLLDMTWDYESDDPHERAQSEPDIDLIVREINGYRIADGEHLRGYAELRDDGSTACGAWIYTGLFPEPGVNLSRRRGTANAQGNATDWAWAWPNNTRTLYNRASADPDGQPVERAQAPRVVGRRGGPLGRQRHARLPGRDRAGLPRARGRARRAGRRRRRALRHAGVRPRGDLRRERHLGRPAGDPLRAARVAGRQRALPGRAVQPGAQGVAPARQPVPRDRRREVPLRGDHLPPHRAPRLGRDVAPAPVAGGAAAGGVLRALAGAGGREGHPQRRLGDGGDGARRDRAAGAGHRPGGALAPGTQALGAPDRDSLPLRLRGRGHRRQRQRLAAAGGRPERHHPRGQGVHVQHPAGSPGRARGPDAGAAGRPPRRADAARQARAARPDAGARPRRSRRPRRDRQRADDRGWPRASPTGSPRTSRPERVSRSMSNEQPGVDPVFASERGTGSTPPEQGPESNSVAGRPATEKPRTAFHERTEGQAQEREPLSEGEALAEGGSFDAVAPPENLSPPR